MRENDWRDNIRGEFQALLFEYKMGCREYYENRESEGKMMKLAEDRLFEFVEKLMEN